ncbi:hypothetical protein CISIN_1g037359mg [Citrus sinensis]|uniref:Uncharacterized protein n=1 Tax=Citrus sinensis TaxID=2711 RepID=A0A067DEM2_CITSI|nr:hypothetical protein CISIN_1g037359mg [Citrus sinensis]
MGFSVAAPHSLWGMLDALMGVEELSWMDVIGNDFAELTWLYISVIDSQVKFSAVGEDISLHKNVCEIFVDEAETKDETHRSQKLHRSKLRVTRVMFAIVKEHGPLTVAETWERVKACQAGASGLAGKSHMKIECVEMDEGETKAQARLQSCGPS